MSVLLEPDRRESASSGATKIDAALEQGPAAGISGWRLGLGCVLVAVAALAFPLAPALPSVPGY